MKLTPVILNEVERFWLDDWGWHLGRFDDAFHEYATRDFLTQFRALGDYLTYNRSGNNAYSAQMVDVLGRLSKHAFAKYRSLLFADIRSVAGELKSGSSAVLRRLVERVIESFPSVEYVDWLMDQIISDIKEPATEAVLARISGNSGAVIAHLFATGFGRDFIRDIPSNLLQRDLQLADGTVVSKLPELPMTPPTLEGSSAEAVAAWGKYNRECATYLNSLTAVQRIAQLKAYLRQPMVERRYIFRVKGAQGTIDLAVGVVEFYSPTVRRFIPAAADGAVPWEFFNDRHYDGFNAAVLVASVEPSGGSARAAQIVEAALNVLKIAINTQTPLRIDGSSFLAVRDDGALLMTSSGNEEALQRIFTPNVAHMMEESRESVKRVGALLMEASPDSVIHKKLLVGLQSFRKVRESTRPEDRLSDAWTILEILISFDETALSGVAGGVENTIASFMSVIEARRTFARHVRDFMAELEGVLFRDDYDITGDKILPLSDDLLRRLQIRSIEPFDIQMFRDALVDGRAAATTLHLKRRFAHIESLLGTAPDQAVLLEEVHSRVHAEVRAIYQLRNQIVHNGYVNFDTVVPYAMRCEALATLALAIAITAEDVAEIDRRLLDDYSAGNRLLTLMNPKFIQAVDVTRSQMFRGGTEAY